jgi:uncharacterized alkaline shock family protein YloU
MTGAYFSDLVSNAVQSGLGVAGMATRGAADSIKSLWLKDFPEKGVGVTEENGKLLIDLHIKVIYGLNIAEAVRSTTHKVKYLVEEATGLEVEAIKVSVDDVVA